MRSADRPMESKGRGPVRINLRSEGEGDKDTEENDTETVEVNNHGIVGNGRMEAQTTTETFRR